jgi:hypothetical protein
MRILEDVRMIGFNCSLCGECKRGTAMIALSPAATQT